MKEVRNIRQKLEYWGIKQQWLADQMNISKALLSYWLTETYDMPQKRIQQAKQILRKIPEPN